MEKEFWNYIRKDEPFDWEDVIWSSMQHNRKVIAKGRVYGDKLVLTDRNGQPMHDSNTFTHWARVQDLPNP